MSSLASDGMAATKAKASERLKCPSPNFEAKRQRRPITSIGKHLT